MSESENPWIDALPAWLPLADLPTTVEAELGIPRRDAAKILRPALERFAIRNALDDKLDSLRFRSEGLAPWVQLVVDDSPGTVAVSPAGWAHVDWDTGTLANYVIRVCWEQVVKVLAPLSAKESEEIGAREAGPVVLTGGRPAKHDWDVFWIQVALYASENDLFGANQTQVQRYMVEWSARHMSDPAPHPTTVRAKISKLFKAVELARTSK